MSVGNHRLVLPRHGETEWSRDRKHTSYTDLGLTETGCDQAKRSALTLGHLGLDNPLVVSSPDQAVADTLVHTADRDVVFVSQGHLSRSKAPATGSAPPICRCADSSTASRQLSALGLTS